MRSWTVCGDLTFDSRKGVAQGSILSCHLFNILLDEALLSSPLLAQMIKREDIRAYADDMVIGSTSLTEMKTALSEIEKLNEWGIYLN